MIYLDHIAATKPHPEVVAAMQPWLTEDFGNPLSLHRFGDKPRAAVEQAREEVARLINADSREIIFTGSGTEANNLAIRGILSAMAHRGRHAVISSIEHPSIIAPARRCEQEGASLTMVPVDRHGVVALEAVTGSLRPDTALASIQLANPEIGTIQAVGELASIAHARGVLVHTDAIAAGGRLAIDVRALDVDALSLAANQFYGPPGVGVLYLKRGVRMVPQVLGGVQEMGRRSGGHNVPAIVGMGRAAHLALEQQTSWVLAMQTLQHAMIKGLSEVEGVLLTGHPERRLPGLVSACFDLAEGEALVRLLGQEGIAAASGSACSDFSVSSKVSHVLSALGIEATRAQGSLVLSLGRETTEDEIRRFLHVLVASLDRLRRLSPLYRAN